VLRRRRLRTRLRVGRSTRRARSIPKLRFVVIILLLACYCHATCIVVVITSQAIFVGTDSYSTSRSPNAPSLLKVDKTFIVRHRFLVASLGAGDLEYGAPGHLDINYHLASWIVEIEKECPENATVASLTLLIEKKSAVAFRNVDRYIATGRLDDFKTRPLFVEYLVAGYEALVPTLNVVRFNIDWRNQRLVGPILSSIYPDNSAHPNFGFYVAGQNMVSERDLFEKKGDSYKELAPLIQKELPKLFAFQNLSWDEATNVCLSVLRVNARHFKKSVGPPYTVTTTVPFGAGTAIMKTTFRR
jgi:hypothetical protein